MAPFHCSSGHRVELAFAEETLRAPCPVCGVDVYKFRDAATEDEAPAAPDVSANAGPAKRGTVLGTTHAHVAIGAVGLAVAIVLSGWHRLASSPAEESHGPVIPIEVLHTTVPAIAPSVSITNFSATPNGSRVVRVNFRLTNAGDAPNDYPGLAVHWHGLPDGDQWIGSGSYAHPPLPFTSADITLELARPNGATGIDVKIAY